MYRLSAAALLCAFLAHSPAQAEQELIVSAGKGLNDALIQRHSIASAEMVGINYSRRVAEYIIGDNNWQWWGQGSYSRLREQHLGQTQHQNILELKPVLRWYPQAEPQGFFAEAGVGAAYLSNRSFGAIDLTTKWNFALHFAGGYRLLGGDVLSLRYSHFSNGYTNRPNPGFDFASINWHFNY